MAAVAVTGKQCTFTYDSLDASAQVTTLTADRTATTDTTQTLADSVVTSTDKEVSYSVEFLFDPATSSLYALLHAAWVSGGPASLVIDYGGATSQSSDVVVTSLSETAPADGLVTVSATLATSTPDTFTPVAP